MHVSYIYDQSLHVMVGTGKLRNTPMNERRYVAYIGVDNTIELQFKNRDRKPVNIMLKTPMWQITNPRTGDAIMRKAATVLDGAAGLAAVKIMEHDLVGVEPGIYHMGVFLESSDGITTASYTDTNYDARAELEIRSGAYEPFRESDTTLSFTEPFFAPPGHSRPIYPAFSGSLKASGQNSDMGTLTTVAAWFSNYSGNVKLQGSLKANPIYPADWFDLPISQDYDGHTGNDIFNVDSKIYWVRIAYNPTLTNVGTIDKVSARA